MRGRVTVKCVFVFPRVRARPFDERNPHLCLTTVEDVELIRRTRMGSGHTSDELVGTWKLVSASTTTSTGERSETPYGPTPTGLLTYTPDGRVTAMISHRGRKPLSTLAKPEEQAEAFKTFLAYAG